MRHLCWTALPLFVCALNAAERKPAEFFEKEIRPLLAERCYQCHSAASSPVMGGLRLDARDGVLKGGSRGAAVVPGEPEQSLIAKAIRYDGALKMPPSAKLSDAEAARINEWIKMGAPWGSMLGPTTRVPTSKFWAFQRALDPPLPAVKQAAWPRNPIDRFILSALEAKGLKPAPQADKRTLIRRATFDLTGLPPTPEEVHAFLADDTPEAFSRVVERLLASERYGERWGRHWLDVARYGDSNGLDENLVFVNAWRYRDYVIKAFNTDKPFDQFVHEQLAGDLLPAAADPQVNYDRLTATGFLALGAKMLAEDDPVKMEMDIVDEQLDTTTRAFMGLTVACARCHDHKFDPIPTADYYSLAGIFRSAKTMENFKVVAKWNENVLAPEADREKLRAHEKTVEAKKKEIEAIAKPANKALQEAARKQVSTYLVAGADLLRRSEIELPHASDGRVIDHVFERNKDFEFDTPAAGVYQIEFHYGSAESRPVELFVNGELVKSKALESATGNATPSMWSVEGAFALNAGKNKIRINRGGGFFPQADKLLIAKATRPDADLPKTGQQLAGQYNVNPEFLSQWSAYLRRAKDDPNSPLKEWFAQPDPERFAKLFADPDQKAFAEILTDKFGPFAVPPNPARYYPADIAAQVKKLEGELKDIEKTAPVYPRAMGVTEGKPANLRIHLRGNYLTLGDETPRQFLRVIAGDKQTPIGATHSGRLELARWLTSPDHPLTSRVMANRIWRGHFGSGIVASTDNFGRLGDMPSNQALLDWLSKRFVESGWSVKAMHRLIMASSAYRQSAAYNEAAFNADPENRLYWRMNRRRLEAEPIRDTVYAAAGGLDVSMGGTMLKFKDREYVTSTENRDATDYDAPRRAVYLPVIRSSLYDVFQAFDFGDPSVPNGDRASTTVAPQALFMMNSPIVMKASKQMAALLIAKSIDPAERVSIAYERVYARKPSAKESERALSFIAAAEKAGAKAWESLCRALMAASEFIYVE